ncbi:MAG TPA: Spy/CpxP family protein refolding chaperone [Rhizomicrobium sp.]|nr:Spy/CpxP family protein refolding chaperone [Rhizomicrobium sp.]
MQQFRTVLLAAALAVFTAPAFAQSAPPDAGARHPWMAAHKVDFAKFHAEMCNGIYAHRVGMVAELGARLDLNDSQRPLYERWKEVVLDGAKRHQGECLAHQPDMSHPPSLLDREARMRDRLKDRLAEMDAQQPALAALYNSLSPEQKGEMDRAARQAFGHMHRGMMGGMHGWHHRGGPEGAPPPGGGNG